MTNATIFQLPAAALPLDPGALIEVDLPGSTRTSARVLLSVATTAAAVAALGAVGTYGVDPSTTAGLVWGYMGGLFNGNTVAAGTIALTDSATNFVVVLRSTGAVSVSTSSANSLNALYTKLFKVTTLGGVVTAIVDQRLDTNGLLLSAGAPPLTPDTDGTLAADSDAVVSSQKAVKTYVDAHVTPPLVPDTDGTLAANSDTEVPSQKAVKTYVDAHVAPPITVDTDGALAANSDAVVPSQKAIKSYVDNQTLSKSTDGTLAADSDAYVPSQKAVKTYVDAHVVGGALDTDPTLAANSDARAASQRATKAYVDTKVAAVVGGLTYLGVWNASTNSPALATGVGPGSGNYYAVGTAGTTSLDGHANWYVGDKVVFNGTAWEKWDGTDTEVLSVAGRTGAVVLSASDVAGLGSAAAAGLDTDTTLSANLDTRVPSQKAVKAYIDAHATTGGSVKKKRSAFVDVAYGNDSTGALDDMGKPFATINAALDAAGNQNVGVFLSRGRHAPIEGDLTPGSPTAINPSTKLGINISVIGSGKPRLDSDSAPTTFLDDSGTIIDGQFTWHSTRHGMTVRDLGVDAGPAVCTARYSGSDGVQGLGTFNVGQIGSLAPCEGVVVENVSVLCKDTHTGHAVAFENCLRPVGDNIQSRGGVHTMVVKSTFGRFSRLDLARGSQDCLIVKESNINNDTARCSDCVFSDVLLDGAGLSVAALVFETASTRPLERLVFSDLLIRRATSYEVLSKTSASTGTPGLVDDVRINNFYCDQTGNVPRLSLASATPTRMYINGQPLAAGGGGGGGGGVAGKLAVYVGDQTGDYSTGSTSFVAIPHTVSIAAAVGDVLEVVLTGSTYSSTAVQSTWRFLTGSGTNVLGQGFFWHHGIELLPFVFRVFHTVTSGDLSAGVVTITVDRSVNTGTYVLVNGSPYYSALSVANYGQ